MVYRLNASLSCHRNLHCVVALVDVEAMGKAITREASGAFAVDETLFGCLDGTLSASKGL